MCRGKNRWKNWLNTKHFAQQNIEITFVSFEEKIGRYSEIVVRGLIVILKDV